MGLEMCATTAQRTATPSSVMQIVMTLVMCVIQHLAVVAVDRRNVKVNVDKGEKLKVKSEKRWVIGVRCL